MRSGRARLWIGLLVIAFLTGILVDQAFCATPVSVWSARYKTQRDAPGPGTANAIVSDSQGNVYVTGVSAGGTTSNDYATVKYGPDGQEIWVARYNGPDSFWEEANALAVDSAGNVYVTGQSMVFVSELGGLVPQIATVKYAPDGQEIWAARFDAPYYQDSGRAIGLDSAGNVVVTGRSSGKMATIKYDPDGNELWASRYGMYGVSGIGHDLAVDDSGNVFVTGRADGPGYEDDYVTVKYDSNGQEVWVAGYTSGPDDWARAIALDGSGNVYVTGESLDVTTGYDYATVKYDPDGNELWVARYSGIGGYSMDKASALAVDASGNVYVTGESEGSGTDDDYATVKYDPDGNEMWVARYNGPADLSDGAVALRMDGSGNIYVTGSSMSLATADYATVKYDSDGNELWATRFDGIEDGHDAATAMAVDGQGNVFVTGGSWAEIQRSSYGTVKYDPDGNELWASRFYPVVTYDNREEVAGLAVDGSGNMYVTGESGEVFPDQGEFGTIKYDPDGNELWVATYGGASGGGGYATDLAVDDSGALYVTGSSETDYATIKYDGNGDELWVSHYNGPGNGLDEPTALAVDAAGNVYVTGNSDGDGTWDDFATVKYDPDGNELWVARYNEPGGYYDRPVAIAVDGLGSVVVTGSGGSMDGYITIKYAPDGTELWVALYNDGYKGRATELAVDSSGNVLVTGQSWASPFLSGVISTVKYDPDGNEQWVAQYTDPTGFGGGTALAVDDAGNVLVGGHLDREYIPDVWVSDYVTIKYDADGNLLWMDRYVRGLLNWGTVSDLALDDSGNVFVAGRTGGISSGIPDTRTIKYGPDGTRHWVFISEALGEHSALQRGPFLTVDGEGAFYVSGTSIDAAQDYVTMKCIEIPGGGWDVPASAGASVRSSGASSETRCANWLLLLIIPIGTIYCLVRSIRKEGRS